MNDSYKKLIMWEKWRDPFGEKDEDDNNNDIDHTYRDLDDDYDDDDDLETDDTDAFNKTLNNDLGKKQIKVIATPMGIIPMNENTASGKIFNFWVGHTNFDITKQVADTIEKADGVETLDIFTRYRFRIGVGKAFYDSEVKQTIQNTVYDIVNNYEIK